MEKLKQTLKSVKYITDIFNDLNIMGVSFAPVVSI